MRGCSCKCTTLRDKTYNSNVNRSLRYWKHANQIVAGAWDVEHVHEMNNLPTTEEKKWFFKGAEVKFVANTSPALVTFFTPQGIKNLTKIMVYLEKCSCNIFQNSKTGTHNTAQTHWQQDTTGNLLKAISEIQTQTITVIFHHALWFMHTPHKSFNINITSATSTTKIDTSHAPFSSCYTADFLWKLGSIDVSFPLMMILGSADLVFLLFCLFYSEDSHCLRSAYHFKTWKNESVGKTHHTRRSQKKRATHEKVTEKARATHDHKRKLQKKRATHDHTRKSQKKCLKSRTTRELKEKTFLCSQGSVRKAHPPKARIAPNSTNPKWRAPETRYCTNTWSVECF